MILIFLFITSISCKKDEDSPNPVSNSGTLIDIDSNTYKTVKIGNQWWMAENLKTTKFNDGADIPQVTDNVDWSGLTTSGYCWVDNDEVSYKEMYGALYNWYAVNTGKLCPDGWHVPTDQEWIELTDYLASRGYTNQMGKVLKSKTGWNDYGNGSDNFGFNALPGGFRYGQGHFESPGYGGYWWTNSEYDATEAWRRIMSYDNDDVFRGFFTKTNGFSIRCVKD